ncbi:MAG TPA: alpha/beta hydrolase [Acidimicrobiales bacterium]|nr:alpha/beta hydrolase [Acidimicrobiales bacterium]
MLLHPNGFCAGLYEPIAAALTSTARPIAIDLLGHGASSAPTDPDAYAFERLAEDVLAVLDVFSPRGVAGVGGSLGGAVAILVDRLDPGRWSRLLLAEPVAFERLSDGRPGANPMADAVAEEVDRDRPGGAGKGGRTFASREALRAAYAAREPLARLAPEALAAYAEWGVVRDAQGVRLACDPEVEATIFESAAGLSGAAAAWDHLARLSCPATIVTGRETFLPDVFAAQAARARAELVTLPGGHFVLHEDTARGVDLIRRYALS